MVLPIRLMVLEMILTEMPLSDDTTGAVGWKRNMNAVGLLDEPLRLRRRTRVRGRIYSARRPGGSLLTFSVVNSCSLETVGFRRAKRATISRGGNKTKGR